MAEAVLLQDAKPQKMVLDDRYYSCTLQLGAGISWRGYRSGEWIEDLSAPKRNPLDKHYRMLAKIHPIRSLPGRVLNGLIGHHNGFLQHNAAHRSPEGDINRMLLVYTIAETQEEPENPVDRTGMDISPIMREFGQQMAGAFRSALGQSALAGNPKPKQA